MPIRPKHVRKLPQRGTWEVDLVAAPEVRIEGVELEGILLIVDSSSGCVRHARTLARGEDLTQELLVAAAAPAGPDRPERPRVLLCRDRMRFRLRPAAKALGAKLAAPPELPGLDEAAASLLGALSGGPSAIPAEPAPWSAAMQALVRDAPWSVLPDSVGFRFPVGPPALRGGVGLILGQAGEQIGFVFYPTDRDLEVFQDLMTTGLAGNQRAFRVWCAHLDPADAFTTAEQDRLRGAGLLMQGLALRLFAMDQDGARDLRPEEEEACLVALQGVVGAWSERGASLGEGPSVTDVQTAAGPVAVLCTGDWDREFDEPNILDVDHQLGLSFEDVGHGTQPVLFAKMAKRDAVRVARRVQGMDAISLEDEGDGTTTVVAWAGDHELGVLARPEFPIDAFRPWSEAGGGVVVISAGGARRRGVRRRDFVAVHPVELLRDDDDEDGEYAPDDLRHVDWDAAPESWPKASTVLPAFLGSSGVGPRSAAAAEELATFGARVWSAVVLADAAGDETSLRALRADVAADPIRAAHVELLVTRKRTLFARDRRIFRVDSCRWVGDQLALQVSWRLP